MCTNNSSNDMPPPKASTSSTVTRTEVEAHRTKGNFWTVVDGIVYDLSNYVDDHPGGPMIMNAAGADASVMFHTYHIHDPAKAAAVLRKFRIGQLSEKETNKDRVEMGDFYRDCAKRVAAALKDQPRRPVRAKIYYILDAVVMASMAYLGVFVLDRNTSPLWLLVLAHLLSPFHVRCIGEAHANGHYQVFTGTALKWAEWAGFVLGYAGIGFGLTSAEQNDRKLLNNPRSVSQYEFTNGRGFGEHAAIHHVKGTDLEHDECHDLVRLKFLFRTTDHQTYLAPLHSLQTYFLYQCVTDTIGDAILCGKFLQIVEHLHYSLVHLIPQKQYGRAMAILVGLVPCVGYFWCYFSLLLSPQLNGAPQLCFVVLAILKEYIGYNPGQVFFAQHVWDKSIPEERANEDWGRYNAETSYSYWPKASDLLSQPMLWGFPFGIGVGSCSATLSYHLEHTLFPGINYLHLPSIAPVVRKCCMDHGIAYHRLDSGADVIKTRRDILTRHDRPKKQ